MGDSKIKVGELDALADEIEKKLPLAQDPKLLDRIEEYRILIRKMAHKYVRARVEYDDLTQEAIIGLILAHRDFNPERSNNFAVYAIMRIKGKMYEYCIRNNTLISVPTHVAKAVAYVGQINRLLGKEAAVHITYGASGTYDDIIRQRHHEISKLLTTNSSEKLNSLKQKIENIATNSKITYEVLVNLAMIAISRIVSEDALTQHAHKNVELGDSVYHGEVKVKLWEALGEKRYMVLILSTQGYVYREIADHLYEAGYTNRWGKTISRQAVKAILDDTKIMIRKMSVFNNKEEL